MPHRKSRDLAQPRKRPTINDVARLANVSKKTVSRVINASPLVRENTRARINAVIAETGFVPDPQARALAFRRSFLIGAIHGDFATVEASRLQQGLLDALGGTGFELVVRGCKQDGAHAFDEIRRFVERQRLAGLVVLPPLSEDSRWAKLQTELGCPVLRILSHAPAPDADAIVLPDRSAGMCAANHLLQGGHTAIALIGGPAASAAARERRQGFLVALGEHGLRLPRRFEREADGTFEGGFAAAKALLGLGPRPSAIVAVNDEMAAGVCSAAREARLSIPNELSVMGMGDEPIAARLSPPLTSIRLPFREIGQAAGAALLSRLGSASGPLEARALTVVLAARQSTAEAA